MLVCGGFLLPVGQGRVRVGDGGGWSAVAGFEGGWNERVGNMISVVWSFEGVRIIECVVREIDLF